jgi:hypothetical protein
MLTHSVFCEAESEFSEIIQVEFLLQSAKADFSGYQKVQSIESSCNG